MDKKQIAILGGAFDPPTIGHFKLATYVLDNTDVSKVWIVPCYKHMYGKNMSDFSHRINMCKLTMTDNRIKIMDIEKLIQSNGQTYDLVQSLFKKYGDAREFSFIIGQDNANDFHKWYNYELLQEMIRFIVVPRKGVCNNGSDWYLKPPHIYLKGSSPIPEISSTEIRQRIKSNDYGSTFFKHMSLPVFGYIKQNHLYI